MGARADAIFAFLAVVLPLLIASLLADMTFRKAFAILGAVLLLVAFSQLVGHDAFVGISGSLTASALAYLAAAVLVLLVAVTWVFRARAIRRAKTLDWREKLSNKEFSRLSRIYFSERGWHFVKPSEMSGALRVQIVHRIKRSYLEFNIVFINSDFTGALDYYGMMRLWNDKLGTLRRLVNIDVLFVVDRALSPQLWARAIADNVTCLHVSQLGLLDDLILQTREEIEALTPTAVDLASSLQHVCLHFQDILAKAGDRKAAIAWAKRAIKAKPYEGRGYFQLSSLYLQEKDLENAYEQAEIALRRQPNNPQFQQRVETLARQTGRVPAAP